MNESYDKSAIVAVLPPVSGGRLRNKSLRAWLSRSDLVKIPAAEELLSRVLQVLHLPYPEQGLAALRMWGQTGDRPTTWIAAADPVYLEPRLDHLCLHALRRPGVATSELQGLIDHLQATLADDNGFGFARLRSYGYLSAKTSISTADVPAYVVDQQVPDEFLPSGDGTATYRNLLGEIEMALHEHEINLQRVEQGQHAVNSLWLWGGGVAPEQQTRPQPPLFSDDALLTGYWHAATGVTAAWPGSIAACMDASVAGFVAETPEFDDSPELLEACLHDLRTAVRSGRYSRVSLLFRDGLRADVRRAHALRFWRRNSPLLAQRLSP
ncbi:MAG: hypothetical protein IH910_04695 [Proteobacteria bacterium]|nr:hypothetical protein [Pseudomonadota bacterium]